MKMEEALKDISEGTLSVTGTHKVPLRHLANSTEI